MSASGGQAAFKGLSSLFTRLPTGTVFLFQFLSPILSNNGKCKPVNKILSSSLVFLCSISCLPFSISDSYTDAEGNKIFGIATWTGMWLGSVSGRVVTEDLHEYRLKVADLVHATFSLIIFGTIAILDTNMVSCFYPEFQSTQSTLVVAIPTLIGAISGIVFVMFPNKRHHLRLKPKASGVWAVEREETQSPKETKIEECEPVKCLGFQQPEEQMTSISYFVTNFPENLTAKDLWIIFSRSVGPVVDVTIPGIWARRGTRFAYVRFTVRSLEDELECARRISCVSVGGYKLVVFPASSNVPPPQPEVNSETSSGSKLT